MIKTDIEIIQTTMLNLINDKSVEMKDIPSRYDNISEKFISVNDLLNSIDMIETNIKERRRCLTPVKKFLFVEDGSVDTDNLIDSLALSNPEIQVIVYRQGGCAPILKDVNEDE